MDTLPAICVNPEGIDTWTDIIDRMEGYNVTLVTTDGRAIEGQIYGTRHETYHVVLRIGNVDEEGNAASGTQSFLLEELTGIVVH